MRKLRAGKPQRQFVFHRALRLEPLEDRALLDAGAVVNPWHNQALPLDVNGDGMISPSDALAVVTELTTVGAGPLPMNPSSPPTGFYDTSGDGVLSPVDALEIITALESDAPIVTLTTTSPITPDLTPQVTVTAPGVPDGTPIEVDVDLQNNGTFTPNYAHATLFNGAATFDLSPALPPSPSGSSYQVNLRAHLKSSDGVVGYSPVEPMLVDTTVSTALADYVNTPDPTYTYNLVQTTPDPSGQGLFTIYDISMTSQTWRSTADVNQPVWKHWERIVVPSGTITHTALLMIDGGSYSSTPPSVDSTILGDAQTAVALHSVFIDLKDIPNEPLVFTGDNPPQNRSEDAIIAYTYNEFMNNLGQPGNNTWPALLPMVKAAVHGMDTTQTFVPSVDPGAEIDNFVVTGYSKRGWTTWLTSTVDPRVVAIIPGVYDNLNVASQMIHQYEVYGFFSPAVQDYNNLNIFGRIATPEGEALGEIIDPYRYLSEPQYASMPKLEINSAGDEFFVSDSAQFYFHDLPGSENYLRYIPNVGHGLDATDPAESTLTFTYAILNHSPLPQFSWTVTPEGTIDVRTVTTPSDVQLWQATNPVARDFRHAYNPSIVWTSSELSDLGSGHYVGSTPMPATGATAFFVQLTFPSPIPGSPYIFTTEIHVNSTLPLYPWPYASTLPVTPPPTVTSSADMNPVATALSSQSATTNSSQQKTTAAPAGLVAISAVASVPATSAPTMLESEDEDMPPASSDDATQSSPEAVDTVLGSSLGDLLQ